MDPTDTDPNDEDHPTDDYDPDCPDCHPWPYTPDTPPPVVTLSANEGQRLLKALCSGFYDAQLANRLAEELEDHLCHPLEAPKRRHAILKKIRSEAASDRDLFRRGYTTGYDIGYRMGHDAGATKGERAGYDAGYHDGQAGLPQRLKLEAEPKATLWEKAKAKRGVPLPFDQAS